MAAKAERQLSEVQPGDGKPFVRTEEHWGRLKKMGDSLVTRLKGAIEARRESGIETVWREDEDFYEGVDDEIRGDSGATTTKPPFRQLPKDSPQSRSKVFPNITRPYVDAGAAKIGDILLPTDDKAWSLKPTPVPDLVKAANAAVLRDAVPGMQDAGVPTDAQKEVVDIVVKEAAAAQRKMAEATERCERAEKRIEDWQIECQWHAEMRRVIDDFAKVGTGILKGPVPKKKKHTAFINGEVVVKWETVPVSARVDYWDFFPGKGCGENIQNGNDVWERTRMGAKSLSDLANDPSYIKEVIDAVLAEGPKYTADAAASRPKRATDGRDIDDSALYEVWFGYCYATKDDFIAAGCPCESDSTMIPAIVTMVNEKIIKVALAPLDTGEFPFDVMPYQRRAGLVWGTGIARQGRTAQLIVTAAVRALLTNQGRSAGPMMVMKNNVVPADGVNSFEAWKVFYASDDDTTDDARKLIAILDIPDRAESLLKVIQLGMKMFEDVTGLPLLLQGQAGEAPDTLGGQQLVDRNASGVLRRVARTVDDCITEPHTRRYYVYLLHHGEDSEKGDFVLDARGSTSLVEKELYKNELQEMLKASLNPAYELSPAKIMEEMLAITKRNPTKLKLSDKEREELRKQQQGPQKEDSSVQTAEIRAKATVGAAQIGADSDMKELQFKAEEAEKQRTHDRQKWAAEERIAVMGYATKRNISLDQAKKELTKTVLTLKAQKEAGDTSVAQPIVEPAPRAQPGQSFSQ